MDGCILEGKAGQTMTKRGKKRRHTPQKGFRSPQKAVAPEEVSSGATYTALLQRPRPAGRCPQSTDPHQKGLATGVVCPITHRISSCDNTRL